MTKNCQQVSLIFLPYKPFSNKGIARLDYGQNAEQTAICKKCSTNEGIYVMEQGVVK